MVASILGTGLIHLSDWSLSNLLDSHYREIIEAATQWSVEDYDNTTQINPTNPVGSMDLNRVVVGFVGCWLDFCLFYTSFTAKFVQLFHAMTLYHYNNQLVALLFKDGVDGAVIQECYQLVLKVTNDCEESFGNMLILTHLETLLLVQIIIRQFLAGAFTIPTIVISLKLAIVYCAYYFSVISSNKV